MNAAAYTHPVSPFGTLLWLAGVPTIEIHLSNIHAREEFRHKSLIAPVCSGQIVGFGADSDVLAVEAAFNVKVNPLIASFEVVLACFSQHFRLGFTP